MTTGNRIFVVAATVQAFNDRKRLLPESSRSDYGIIPVLNDADMRGRSVMVGDLALVCGDWSGTTHERIKRLCDMFNSRRDVTALNSHEIPLLRYKPGEAPEVGYPNPPGPVSRENYPVLTTHTATTNTINTTDPVVVQTLNGNQFTFGIETTIPPQGSSGNQSSFNDDEVLKMAQELAEAKVRLDDIKELIAEQDKHMEQLASWLSGVQPVEDTEIPGIFWCAVCSKQLPAHADGCPAAP